ncbi:serine/threonine protein kinase [Planomonospora venezuelensis]|uniref:Protein kinase domain-containing protein n=2 Tax=Planomonospora venezuelensis TaxID=1999 RepID=A0A841D5Q3_PLAVE|nr:hypothetical protein [Planomonospora venezuelensis]GIM99573.1 hypothetical protein Pve01_12320 [Planomonospora venezuelensis]
MSRVRELRKNDPKSLGPYRTTGFLGEGGQGSVLLGLAPDGSRVAIKVLHTRLAEKPEAVRRFRREVDTARRVAQFCTARILDLGVEDGVPYVVSEYVEGVSLEETVRGSGPLHGDDLVRLAVGTVTALTAVHRAGIVHRDFKPSNVLMAADGPRVIDFGVARALDVTSVTSSGVVGSPAYISPEQIRGGPVGPAADLFGWAGTMVFAATGAPAFGADSVPAVFHRVLSLDPDLSAVPERLRRTLSACLAKDPALRPDAQEVLLALMDEGHVLAEPPREAVRPGEGNRARKIVLSPAAAGGTAVAAAVAGVVFFWPLGGTAGPPRAQQAPPVPAATETVTATAAPAAALTQEPSPTRSSRPRTRTTPAPTPAREPQPEPTRTPTPEPSPTASGATWKTDSDLIPGPWKVLGPRGVGMTGFADGTWRGLLWGKRPKGTHFTVSVRTKLLATGDTSPTPKYGLLLSHTEGHNDIGVYIETKPGYALATRVWDDGTASDERTDLPADFDPADFHTLKVVRKGSHYHFFLDGVKLQSRTADVDPQGHGWNGVAATDSKVTFKKFTQTN